MMQNFFFANTIEISRYNFYCFSCFLHSSFGFARVYLVADGVLLLYVLLIIFLFYFIGFSLFVLIALFSCLINCIRIFLFEKGIKCSLAIVLLFQNRISEWQFHLCGRCHLHWRRHLLNFNTDGLLVQILLITLFQKNSVALLVILVHASIIYTFDLHLPEGE